MSGGAKKSPVRGRDKDPLIAIGEKEARGALRATLRQFIRRFEYSVVKDELSKARREEEEENASAALDPQTRALQIRNRRYQRLQHVWLAVERVRRSARPELTAREACNRIAAGVGIAEFESFDGRLGIGPRVVSRLAKVSTIEREFKRAESMRRSTADIDWAWHNLLADLVGGVRRPLPQRLMPPRGGQSEPKITG